MKKKGLLAALLLLFAATAAYAQPRAIGVRFSNGIEASYQHALGSANMVSVDFGLTELPWHSVEAAATYDWIFPINSWQYKGEWNWYAGVGAALGYSGGYAGLGDAGFVGAAGRIGVEYNFWFPLQLSIDWRPVFGVAFDKYDVRFTDQNLYNGVTFALGVRYLF